MKFNTKVDQIMKESLLDGNAEYGDVMDAVTALVKMIEDFKHVYPMDRGTHVHGTYKAEIDRMTGRVGEWINMQTEYNKHKSEAAAKTKEPGVMQADGTIETGANVKRFEFDS